jgi:hypothetical protein
MRSKVSSDWLPSYIKATRPVLEIFKMAGHFPDNPRMLVRSDVWRNFLPPSSRYRTVTYEYTDEATFKSPLRYWSAGVRFDTSPTTHSLKQQWLHMSLEYIGPQPSHVMTAPVTIKRSYLNPSDASQGREIFTHELRVSCHHRIRIRISSLKLAQRTTKHSFVGLRAPAHTMPG